MQLRVDDKLLTARAPRQPADVLSVWERRDGNVFRGVVDILCRSAEAAHVEKSVRAVIRQEFDLGFFVPFAFGTVLRFDLLPPRAKLLDGLVDGVSRSKGTWQWLIVASDSSMTAHGIHMWSPGYLTPVYRDLLLQFEKSGYQCRSVVKPPHRFFKGLWLAQAVLAKGKAALLVVISLVIVVSLLLALWNRVGT